MIELHIIMQVVINGLYDAKQNQMINFDRPIKVVAMDPHFYKSRKHFVTGDDKVCFCKTLCDLCFMFSQPFKVKNR